MNLINYGASLLGSQDQKDYPIENLRSARENVLIENRDVVLENIEISYPGLGTQADANREVPEDITRYPEQFFFGPLPAWGAYIRHAKNITFKNVAMELRAPDARERIVLVDVEGFVEESERAPL